MQLLYNRNSNIIYKYIDKYFMIAHTYWNFIILKIFMTFYHSHVLIKVILLTDILHGFYIFCHCRTHKYFISNLNIIWAHLQFCDQGNFSNHLVGS